MNEWDVIANPVLHDKSSNLLNGAPTPFSEDRNVLYGDGSSVKQRQDKSGGMTYADTVDYIIYKANPLTSDYISGTVNMKAYLEWLNRNGYNLDNITIQ